MPWPSLNTKFARVYVKYSMHGNRKWSRSRRTVRPRVRYLSTIPQEHIPKPYPKPEPNLNRNPNHSRPTCPLH